MPADLKTEELTAIITEIRDRVRARYPEGTAGAGIPLPDLLPILHERDAAEGKVAAIGTVNPRPPGLLNSLAQSAKKLVARALGWHVRDQVEFNRAMVRSLDAVLEALNDNNRALKALGERAEALGERAEALSAHVDRRVDELLEVRDIRARWSQWHVEWETKLNDIEQRFFRNVAELNGAFQHRATLLEASLRDTTKLQHADFLAAMERGTLETQKRLWGDLEAFQKRVWDDFQRLHGEFERQVRAELRLIRLRAALPQQALPPAAAPTEPPAAAPPIDWLHFADRFRGLEEHVREGQRFYLPHFAGCRDVLDIGCGRGEFLELLKEAGIPARGIDLSAESVALCRSKGLDAEVADLFSYLDALPDGALDGIFCAHVIEHLPPTRLPEMLRLACAKLGAGGLLALETPNPECLAILASHFYIDPTHQHPVPPRLVQFYLEEFGMGQIQILRLAPAADTMPALNSLPPDVRDAFFGALDYALLSRKANS